MFKRKPSKAPIETLIGARTRINGDVEFAGGLHLDGHINGNVTTDLAGSAVLSVSERGTIEGSVVCPERPAERDRQRQHRRQQPGRAGRQGPGARQRELQRP